MSAINPIVLAQELIRIDTSGPQSCEAPAAELIARLLSGAGFEVEAHSFAPGRPSLVARAGGNERAPLVISGHLDTVPVEPSRWAHSPFGASQADGVLYGRGSADMKSGVAAIVAAATSAASEGLGQPLVLLLTAGEEVGCLGALHLRDLGVLPRAVGVLIAEPTGNRLGIGHRGALWLRAIFEGRGAHGSTPHLGHNAIYDAVDAVARCRLLQFLEQDPLLGQVSLNIGLMRGGINVNSVPDHAEFTIDIRSIAPDTHGALAAQVAGCVGRHAEIETLVDLPAVRSDAAAPFAKAVSRLLGDGSPVAVPFFTDGSILASSCAAPTVIVGPGESGMAHQTDESCPIHQIEDAAAIYYRLAMCDLAATPF